MGTVNEVAPKMLYDFFTNRILLIPLCAWAIAQLVKLFVALVEEKRLDLHYLISSGGMPSAHSATVAALATIVGLTDGFGSVTFGLATVLAIVVMYDAAGVRQSVSKQSVVLNRIVRELQRRRPLIELESDLRELVGHTPFQVIVGALLGVAVTLIWIAIASL